MGEKKKKKKKDLTGERRLYIRYACSGEFKTIIDFNPDVARRARSGKIPPIVFRRGEKAVVRNISEKGIAVELDHILTEGMTLKMALENPITPPIQTGARVVWAKKMSGGKGGYVMGMAFRYMREKHRRNLETLLGFLESIPE
jgi:hypothetical protein